jgi:peptidoglycan/xylan/chitin deacetylase (PgdA/CDA1 family)
MIHSWGQGVAIGAGAIATAGLVAGGYAYAAMWPASQLFGSTLIAPPRPGEIALTFDDGPNPAWTPRLLESLARHRVRATFFLVGRFAETEQNLTREIAAAGHLIGNHTWTHPNLALSSGSRIREELVRTRDVLEQITGARVGYFRPPFGARRPGALREARNLGMVPVMWNAMTNDWEEPDQQKIAARIATKVEAVRRRGRAANIVLHDGGHLVQGSNRGPSVGAAELLLQRFGASHRFVAVDAWATLGKDQAIAKPA